MRLAWVRAAGRAPELVALDGDAIAPIGRRWPDGAAVPPDAMSVIAGETTALALARDALARTTERLAPNDVTFLAAVPAPPRIFALARNYGAHARERGGEAERGGSYPQVFLKPPAGTLNHHGGAIPLRAVNDFLDYEAELAVVIGTGGEAIPADRARDHVFGYTIVNDVSERRLHADAVDRKPVERDAFFDWLVGKWMPGSCPIGPCIATRDAIADPHALRIRCAVNGEVRQDASSGDMIHRIDDTIAFVSRIVPLLPGDVIATGTPAGVGKARGTALAIGDRIAITIDGIGTLENTIAAPRA